MTRNGESTSEKTRRSYLLGLGSATIAGGLAGCSGNQSVSDASPTRPSTEAQQESKEQTDGSKSAETDFLSRDDIEAGRTVTLGDGTVTTFGRTDSTGATQRLGMMMDRSALENLPGATTLEDSGDDEYTDKYGRNGLSELIHTKWSQEFFIPFPETTDTPFTFLGLNWNPAGHPPEDVWAVPHFDVHFHMFPMESIDAIEGPRAPEYELPDRYIPDGYARPPNEDERVITDMGEHLAPGDAPELNGGEFTNTLIWGVYTREPNGDEPMGELAFAEPMVTREYLREFTGSEQVPIRHPAVHRRPGRYPTAYAVRELPEEDAVAVTVEALEEFEGET